MEPYTKSKSETWGGYLTSNAGSYYTTGPQPGIRVDEVIQYRRGGTTTLNSSLNGFKNPNWREQVRRHSQAGTPCTGLFETVKYSGHLTTWNYVPFRKDSGYWGPQEKRVSMQGCSLIKTAGGGAASLSHAENKALTQLYQRIDSVTSGLKSLVAAGEMAETLRMLRTPTKALIDGIYGYLDDVKRQVKAVKRGRRLPIQSRITRLNAIVAGLWLEKSFGWEPLISDIESAADSVAKLSDRVFINPVIIRSRGESVGTPSYIKSGLTGIGFPSGTNLVWRQERKVSVQYIACVDMEPRTTLGVVKDAFGIHFREFLPTIWELIPYSFLIDYGTNFGDIVASNAVNVERVKWIVRSTRDYICNTVESAEPGLLTTDPSEVRRVLTRPSVTYEKGTFTRELLPDLDLPHLEFEIPGLGSRKWINVLALARTSRAVERLIARSLH